MSWANRLCERLLLLFSGIRAWVFSNIQSLWWFDLQQQQHVLKTTFWKKWNVTWKQRWPCSPSLCWVTRSKLNSETRKTHRRVEFPSSDNYHHCILHAATWLAIKPTCQTPQRRTQWRSQLLDHPYRKRKEHDSCIYGNQHDGEDHHEITTKSWVEGIELI